MESLQRVQPADIQWEVQFVTLSCSPGHAPAWTSGSPSSWHFLLPGAQDAVSFACSSFSSLLLPVSVSILSPVPPEVVCVREKVETGLCIWEGLGTPRGEEPAGLPSTTHPCGTIAASVISERICKVRKGWLLRRLGKPIANQQNRCN